MRMRKKAAGAKRPCFMTKGAACADVFLPCAITIEPHSVLKVPLGIAFDLDPDTKIVMYPRSSLLVKFGIMQPVSIIDEDHHGEVHAPLFNLTDKPVSFEAGERVAQIEVQTVMNKAISLWEVKNSERDQEGFGGTGK